MRHARTVRTSAPWTSSYVAWRSGSPAWRRSASPSGQASTRRSAPATLPCHSTRGVHSMIPAGIASANAGTGRVPPMPGIAAA
jgi:hypothetical protein